MEISLLLPTHNRGDLLDQTLASLLAVRLPPQTPVELVVVANACTDNTAAVVAKHAAAAAFPIRLVEERQANLNIARNRAVQESRYGICALLDDDILLDPGYLEALVAAYRDNPADLVAGRVLLWWQAVNKPAWFVDGLSAWLSANDRGDALVEAPRGDYAIGANLSFRRSVYDRLGGFVPGLDRTAKRLLAAGERLFVDSALRMGMRMFYCPQVLVYHWVPPQRVSLDYIYATAFGTGQSFVFMKPEFGVRGFGRTVGGHAMLWTRYRLREWRARRRKDTGEAAVAAAMRQLSAGSLCGALARAAGRSPADRAALRTLCEKIKAAQKP